MSESEGSYMMEQLALEDLERFCAEEIAMRAMREYDDYLTWYTKLGQGIPYAQLTDLHLLNIDAMLTRNGIRLPNLRAEVGRRGLRK